jgi:acetate kinase
VHGGTRFTQPAVVDESVMAGLAEVRDLAPLHNPPAIALMEACRARYPELPQVAVFDTAFHATIPEPARTYALPRPLCAELGIRKYGFHGTSHQYVMEEAASLLRKPIERFSAVSCHLGSGGASLCALVNGRSVDNTMGFSPLQGLVMSTRSGDLDPAVTMRLLAQSEGDSHKVVSLLNTRSGVLGLSGTTADIRDIIASNQGSSPSDRLAETEQVYLWRLRKYLGAYLVTVPRPEAVIFTDTIGETVPEVRWNLCTGMEVFGLHLDAELNSKVKTLPADVALKDSPVRILVIQTNEELAIARRTHAALLGAEPAIDKGEAA